MRARASRVPRQGEEKNVIPIRRWRRFAPALLMLGVMGCATGGGSGNSRSSGEPKPVLQEERQTEENAAEVGDNTSRDRQGALFLQGQRSLTVAARIGLNAVPPASRPHSPAIHTS